MFVYVWDKKNIAKTIKIADQKINLRTSLGDSAQKIKYKQTNIDPTVRVNKPQNIFVLLSQG
jgi:hypothetical protein